MEREAYQKLKSWRTSATRKPLLMRGVRHVGKTWLLHEFGRHEYDRIAYVDFTRESTLKEVFSGSYSGRELLLAVQLQLGFRLYPKRTLIVLDEIQELPDAVGVLARLHADAPEYHVIAAESRVAHAYAAGQGFPADSVETMFLRPISYTEFLRAVEKTELADFLETRDWKMLSHFHDDYVSQLIMYCLIGGMPNAVNNFIKRKDFRIVRQLQMGILQDYRDSFERLARRGLQNRLALLWESLPRQLDSKTHKFRYNIVAPGLGARELEAPMAWLVENGFVRQIARVDAPELPLEAHRDGAFKGYLLDIGLLTARLGIDMASFLETSRLFERFHGTLAEQIVQQELAATMGEKPHYWSAPRGKAAADFLVQSSGHVIPVDVAGVANPRAKKLAFYCEKFQPPVAVRISLAKYQCRRLPIPGAPGRSYTLIDLPLYAVSQLAPEIQAALNA